MDSRPPSPARTSSPPHFTGVEAHFTDDLDQSHWSWSTAAIAPLHTATRPRYWYNSKTMRRLAIGITKGGSGKTATACHLAHGLARAGHRVLLVDADDQDQARLYFGVQPDTGLDSVALGKTAWKDAAVEVRPGLKLLAAGSGLDGIATWMAREDHAVSALRDQLPRRGFDFVIVDRVRPNASTSCAGDDKTKAGERRDPRPQDRPESTASHRQGFGHVGEIDEA